MRNRHLPRPCNPHIDGSDRRLIAIGGGTRIARDRYRPGGRGSPSRAGGHSFRSLGAYRSELFEQILGNAEEVGFHPRSIGNEATQEIGGTPRNARYTVGQSSPRSAFSRRQSRVLLQQFSADDRFERIGVAGINLVP